MIGHDQLVADGGSAGAAAERRPQRPRPLSTSHVRTGISAALGAGLGAAYAYFIGCETGTCPITSSVWTAGLYGTVVGGIAGWPARRRGQR